MYEVNRIEGPMRAFLGSFPTMEDARDHIEHTGKAFGFSTLAFEVYADHPDCADMMTGDGRFQMNQYTIEKVRV